MNDNPHLMAIIDAKMAQSRLCLRHGDAAKADELLMQVGIYAAALSTHGNCYRPNAGEASDNRR